MCCYSSESSCSYPRHLLQLTAIQHLLSQKQMNIRPLSDHLMIVMQPSSQLPVDASKQLPNNLLNMSASVLQARDKADGLREHREATCSSSSDSASAAASEAAPDNWEILPRRQSLSGQKRASCDLPPAAAHEAVREASGNCAPLHPDQGELPHHPLSSSLKSESFRPCPQTCLLPPELAPHFLHLEPQAGCKSAEASGKLHAGSSEVLTQKWRRVADAFDSLETLYFHRRQTSALAASAAPSALPGSQPQLPQAQLLQPADHTPDGPDPLAAFSEDLTRFARNSRFEVGASPPSSAPSCDLVARINIIQSVLLLSACTDFSESQGSL